MLTNFFPSISTHISTSNHNNYPLASSIMLATHYKNALINAIKFGHCENAKLLIDKIITKQKVYNPHKFITTTINKNKDSNGNNLFLQAVISNKVAMATLLLENGADINSVNNQHQTAAELVAPQSAKFLKMCSLIQSKQIVTTPQSIIRRIMMPPSEMKILEQQRTRFFQEKSSINTLAISLSPGINTTLSEALRSIALPVEMKQLTISEKIHKPSATNNTEVARGRNKRRQLYGNSCPGKAVQYLIASMGEEQSANRVKVEAVSLAVPVYSYNR